MTGWVGGADAAVARVLATRYGLTAGAIERLDRDSLNAVFRVRTGAGTVVVKRLGRPATRDWLEYQADTLDALHAKGFPTQPLRRTVDGDGTATADGYQWQVSSYVGGRPYTPGSEADLDAAARCLDSLHALSDHEPRRSPASPVQDVEPWLRGGEDDLAELLRTVTELAPDAAAGLCPAYRAAWERARAELPQPCYFALPCRLTHGEYVSSNLLFAGDAPGDGTGDGTDRGPARVATVVDWDALQVRPRVSDVARGALFFARRARGGIEVFEHLVPRFIELATVSAPLNTAEMAAVIPFLELYFLPDRGYLRALSARHRPLLDWYLGWSAAGAGRVRDLLTPVLTAQEVG